jgi:hypothetical protein
MHPVEENLAAGNPIGSLTELVKSSMENKTRDVKCYVELHYYSATKEEVFDRFLMDFPCTLPYPVSAEPTYDARVDARRFTNGGDVDIAGLNRAVDGLARNTKLAAQ